MNAVTSALFRTLCYVDAIDYAPTFSEWIAWMDHGVGPVSSRAESIQTARQLIMTGQVSSHTDRITFPERTALVTLHTDRALFMPRKLRAARRVVSWLRRIQGVRFVALCNTTALAHARDAADLDFFVITARDTVWQTRGWATLPYKLFNRRPRPDQEVPDAVCLSFFLDETAMDLQKLALSGSDPYLRYWFLSLLPLYDDGIGQLCWEENKELRQRHPFASPWMLNTDIARSTPLFRIPTPTLLDRPARRLQERVLPRTMQKMDQGDTSVVCNDHILKFHTQDARTEIRARYAERCKQYGVEP